MSPLRWFCWANSWYFQIGFFWSIWAQVYGYFIVKYCARKSIWRSITVRNIWNIAIESEDISEENQWPKMGNEKHQYRTRTLRSTPPTREWLWEPTFVHWHRTACALPDRAWCSAGVASPVVSTLDQRGSQWHCYSQSTVRCKFYWIRYIIDRHYYVWQCGRGGDLIWSSQPVSHPHSGHNTQWSSCSYQMPIFLCRYRLSP